MPHAVVSGGASGIGLECAVQLAEAGYDVSILDLSITGGVKARTHQCGRRLRMFKTDVADRIAVRQAVSDAVRDAGGGVDAVVAAAGIWGTDVSIDELDEAELDRVLRVNLYGTVWLAQATLPFLRVSQGRLVCIGSEAGRVGGRRVGVPYAASKGAVHTVVRTLARQEAGNGVLVNGVAPGLTRTPMIEGRGYDESSRIIGRAATPGEIASVAVFLCSPGASYVSGAVIDVNGAEYVS